MPVEPPLDTQDLVQRALHHQVRLPEYSQPVYIEDAQSIDDLVSLAVRTRDGQTEQITISAADLAAVLDQILQQDVNNAPVSTLDFFLEWPEVTLLLACPSISVTSAQADPVSLYIRFCLSQ